MDSLSGYDKIRLWQLLKNNFLVPIAVTQLLDGKEDAHSVESGIHWKRTS